MDERYILWEPIPREQNRYFDVTVIAFEQTLQGQTETLSVTLFSSPDAASDEEEGAGVWRIRFTQAVAYRRRLIPDWPGTTPFPRPDDRWLAFWEVSPSSWLDESIPPGYGAPMHHFVIASEYDAYEVIARSWMSEEISHRRG